MVIGLAFRKFTSTYIDFAKTACRIAIVGTIHTLHTTFFIGIDAIVQRTGIIDTAVQMAAYSITTHEIIFADSPLVMITFGVFGIAITFCTAVCITQGWVNTQQSGWQAPRIHHRPPEGWRQRGENCHGNGCG